MVETTSSAWTRDTKIRSNLYDSIGGSAVRKATSFPNATLPATITTRQAGVDPTSDAQRNQNFSEQLEPRGGLGSSDSYRGPQGTGLNKTPTNCLWLGGLDPSLHKRDDLLELFKDWPGFCDISMPDSGGYFAFASFETVEDAVDAKNFIGRKYHYHISGKQIKVNFGRQTNPVVHADRVAYADTPDVTLPQPTVNAENVMQELEMADDEVPDDADEDVIFQQENEIRNDVTYYEDDVESALNRNEIDEIVGKVDRVRRSSGGEELRDCLKWKRVNAKEALGVILKRIIHLYTQDTHKKLLILYAIGDFFYCLPPHRRYDIGEAIGENIIDFLSVIASYQCDKGKIYVSDVAASLYFYFTRPVRKMLENFIDIEVLLDLKQDEVGGEDASS